MFCRVMALAAVTMFLSGQLARAAENREQVEAYMSAALVERGAIRACIALQPEADRAEFVRLLDGSWLHDLRDTAKLLIEAGYPADFVRPLLIRLNLEHATPAFADREALTRFCATQGDWMRRWYNLRLMFPQVGLPGILKKD